MEKIKKILLMENKLFEKLHIISITSLIIVAIFLAVEIYLNNIIKKNDEPPLENIEVLEDTDKDTTITKTYDNQEVLLNPGKGWVLYNSKETDKYNDVISIGYTRIDWCDIEPEEGVFNWNIIDEKIANYKNKGKKYSFGILCASSSSKSEYVTPKWVFDAGANYYTY